MTAGFKSYGTFVRTWRVVGYGWRVLANRPFALANKRMALAAVVTYLEINGLTWECGEVGETTMVLRAAGRG